MPNYEYACSTCGQSFELMQDMSEDALTTCNGETCHRKDGKRRGRGKLQKVLFAPAIHFKGSGFHNTDYGSKRRDSGGGGDSGDSDSKKKDSGGTSSDSGSSDSGSSGKTVGLNDI